MEKDTKICPYCGKEIKSIAIKCKYCGKFIEDDVNEEDKCPKCGSRLHNNIIANIFKVIVYLICAFFLLVSLVGIFVDLPEVEETPTQNKNITTQTDKNIQKENKTAEQKQENSVQLTNSGYKSIKKKYIHKKTMLDLFKGIEQEEKDLLEFFQNSKSIEDNTKLFEIFMDNLFKCSSNFDSLYNRNPRNLEKDYSLQFNGDFLNTEKIKVINPKANAVYFQDTGGNAYPYELVIDYDYILKKYGKYFNSVWTEYCKLAEQESKEVHSVLYKENEVTTKVYSKWVKKWKDFLEKHPDFYLKTQIKNGINFYNEYNQQQAKKEKLETLNVYSCKEGYFDAVCGVVKNNLDRSVYMVSVDITLYDSNGNVVSNITDIIDELRPNQTWKFKALIDTEDAVRYQFNGVSGL